MPIPVPPPELATYVGERHSQDPVAAYLGAGRGYAAHLVSGLPPGFRLEGKRVLDFGCGSGRILRHMLERCPDTAFDGCDIHRESIEWLAPHLEAPHDAFVSGEVPPIDRPDGHYQLIFATSVFSHLAASWSRWLLEMHRLLDDDGLLMATHIGPGYAAVFDENPWQEERIGMLVLNPGNPWPDGGPMVLHSEWWIRTHWGRCFEILSFELDGFGATSRPPTQGLIVMRKRPIGAIDPQDLEQLEPGEPRELSALLHGLERSHAESVELNSQLHAYAGAYHQLGLEHERAMEEYERIRAALREAERPRNAARSVVRGVRARLRSELGRR